MNNLVIYELLQGFIQSGIDKKSQVYHLVKRHFSKEFEVDKEPTEIEFGDIPKSINNFTANNFAEIIQDSILTFANGYPKGQVLGQKYYECHKQLFLAEILNTLLLKRAALFVAEQLVKKSKKYFFINITFQAYRIMYVTRVSLKGDHKDLEASENFLKYLKFYEIEKNMEIEYNHVFKKLIKSTAFDEEVIHSCGEIIEKYRQYEKNIPSFYFHYQLYHLDYVRHVNLKENERVYSIAKNALEYFDSLHFVYNPGRLVFMYILIIHSIQHREFDEGQALIERAKEIVSKKSPQWFRIKENELILNFHRGYFTEAINTFLDVANNKSFVSINPTDKSRWILNEAYVNLAIETGSGECNVRRKRFSVQKFINELPGYSKDKRAMNIPILIAQMVFFIVRRQYNHAIDRIEALEKYSSRYLRNDETFRSNCFIKMLLEIPKNSFNRLRVERASQKYFERLIDSEVDLINQPFEIEIIPYERLWAMIMNHLRADHHYTPKKTRAA